MIQEMTFKKQNGMKIQGRMYLPEEREGRLPLVIFCHGFGSNFRELMHHGDGFAQAGICCLFFDFCGGGRESLSDGTMEVMTVESECGDLETVIAYMKKLDYIEPERIFLQGESMGGLVTALVAARHPEGIRALVLWYPAFSIPEDSQRRYLAGENEVFGIVLGKEFDEQARLIDVYGRISEYGGPVLLIHGTEDQIVPVRCSEKAVSVYADARLIRMPGAGHGYEGADSAAAREYSIAFVREHCV
ncbi:MAG TPA: hypothetical protein DCZ91_06805 [Lachnospiraceae bacterium]|nr:hypothetical protein [Lachnospiraceae bacterium]